MGCYHGRQEWRVGVLEYNCYNVIPNVPFSLELEETKMYTSIRKKLKYLINKTTEK